MASADQVNALLQQARQLQASDAVQAAAMAAQALELSRRLGKPALEAEALNCLGNAEALRGHFGTALGHYNNALALTSTLGNRQQAAGILKNKGSAFLRMGEQDKALAMFLEALAAYEATADRQGEAMTCNNLGALYEATEDYPLAQSYYQRALTLKLLLNDTLTIGKTYGNLGNLFSVRKAYDSALYYYQMAIGLGEKHHNFQLLGTNHSNLGYLYWETGDNRQALAHYLKGLEYDRLSGNRYGEAVSLMNVASAYRSQKAYDQALASLISAAGILRNTGAKDDAQKALKDLAAVYADMGRHSEAYGTHQAYALLKDSVFSEEKARLMAEMQAKYDLDKKEQQNLLLVAENQRAQTMLYASVLISVLLAGMGITALKLKQSQLKVSKTRLRLRESELTAYTQHLLDKDRLIAGIQAELGHLQLTADSQKISSLEQLLHARLSTEADWVAFKQRFELLYPGFFTKLSVRFPGLSPAETKICALEKLGIRDGEAGGILGVSPGSVKKSRYRLRKSLSDDEKASLKAFIESY